VSGKTPALQLFTITTQKIHTLLTPQVYIDTTNTILGAACEEENMDLDHYCHFVGCCWCGLLLPILSTFSGRASTCLQHQ
jgi:hypothetical protein